MLKKLHKFRLDILIGSIALLIFGIVSLFANVLGSLSFDTAIFEAISSLRNDFFTPFFKVITFFANKYFTIIFVIIMAFVLINRDKSTYKKYLKNDKANNFVNLIMAWIMFALSVILVTLLFFIFKAIFGRVRPVDWFLVEEIGYSFPSGHSATAVAMYGGLALIICKSNSPKWLKTTSIIVASILSILIGISRIFLGVHYATDVLAGWALGVVTLSIISMLIKFVTIKIQFKSAKFGDK